MAFYIKITCDFCKGNGTIEKFEDGSVFITCEQCGQEREITLQASEGDKV